jgi:hypothetical protein
MLMYVMPFPSGATPCCRVGRCAPEDSASIDVLDAFERDHGFAKEPLNSSGSNGGSHLGSVSRAVRPLRGCGRDNVGQGVRVKGHAHERSIRLIKAIITYSCAAPIQSLLRVRQI